MANLRPYKIDLRLEKKRADLRPGRADFRLKRVDSGQRGLKEA